MVLDDLAGKAHELGNDLGDDHDLVVLDYELDRQERHPARAAVQAIRRLIPGKRAALQRRAFQTGKKLYAIRPNAFAGRLAECWRRWHRRPQSTAEIR